MAIFACYVAFCCSTANGYDGSLFGTLLANDDFKKFYNVGNVGIQAGKLWLDSLRFNSLPLTNLL